MTTTWQIEVCDRFGAQVVPLDNAIPRQAAERLNEARTATFEIGVKDAGAIAADIMNCVIRRDARIRRNDQVFLWGPITRVEAGRRSVQVQVSDPWWHLHGLYFGPLRNQYILNPNAASGLANWSASGLPTFTADTADFVRGSTSFLLEQPTTGADAHMSQTVLVTSNVDQPVVFVLSGWVKVEEFKGPALDERGLYIERAGKAVSTGVNPRWDAITEATPVGEWVPLATEITVPANLVNDPLNVRVYCPNGRMRVGGLALTVYESVGTPTFPEDAIYPITRVISTVQDPLWGYPPLNIAKAGGLTGSLIEIHHQFVDGENVGQALLGYARRGICDMGFVYPTPNTRTLEIFSPRRGTFKPDVLLDTDVAGSLAEFRYRVDGGQTWSAVRADGAGSGPARPVGFATDYTATDGIRREGRLTDVPTGALPIDLDRLTVTELARAKAPVRIPTYTTHRQSGDLVEFIQVGDSALSRIDHGCVQEETVRRIVGWNLDIRRESMTLEVAT